MPDLVTADDLPASLKDVDPALLAGVVDDIRSYCGWHIAPQVTETVVVDADGGSLLRLPSLLVDSIGSVVDGRGNQLPVGRVYRNGLARGVWPDEQLRVTLTHGYESVPPALVEVIADMIRDRQSAASGPTVSSAKLDGADVSYSDPYAARGSSSAVGARRGLGAYGYAVSRFRIWNA